MTEFDDMTKRILDKLDTFDEKLDDLCVRMIKVEYDLRGHFLDIDRRNTNKEKKFYIVISTMAIVFTAFEVFQNIM